VGFLDVECTQARRSAIRQSPLNIADARMVRIIDIVSIFR